MTDIRLADGRTLEFDSHGAGRRTLVFLHSTPIGQPVSPDWSGLRDCRVLLPFRPGYRGSTPMRARSVADLSQDIVALLDKAEVERALFYGVSGGGPYAIACAALAPERTVAAVSDCGPAPWPPGESAEGHFDENPLQLLSHRLLLESQNAPDYWLEGMLGAIRGNFTSVPPAFDEKFRLDGEGWWSDSMAVALRPWGFDLSKVRVPVKVLRAGFDHLVPRHHAEHLVREIGESAELLDFPQSGHVVSSTPGAVNELVNNLLSR